MTYKSKKSHWYRHGLNLKQTLFMAGSKEAWRKESIKRPMPVFYHLRSITELFNGNYFKIDDVDIRAVGEQLLEALKVRQRIMYLGKQGKNVVALKF